MIVAIFAGSFFIYLFLLLLLGPSQLLRITVLFQPLLHVKAIDENKGIVIEEEKGENKERLVVIEDLRESAEMSFWVHISHSLFDLSFLSTFVGLPVFLNLFDFQTVEQFVSLC